MSHHVNDHAPRLSSLPRPLALALLATLALHAGLWWLASPAGDQPPPAHSRHAALHPLHTPGWVVVAARAQRRPAGWADRVQPNHSAPLVTATAPTPRSPVPHDQQTPALNATHAPDAFTTAVPQAAPAPALAMAPSDPTPLAGAPDATDSTPGPIDTPTPPSPYYSRHELDVAPSTTDTVLIAFPAGVDLGGRHTGRLQLYIDEAGVVQAVEFERDGDATLPPPMQDAARDAFMKARFTPGQRQGMAARARLLIEVSFDEQPAAAIEAQTAPPTSPVSPPQGSSPRA